jgi:hypothetical protein
MEDQVFYNFIESLHIFYTEFSYTSWLTKYMKYCNILDRNADNLLFLNGFLLNLEKQKLQR